jgi:hypothetical protein
MAHNVSDTRPAPRDVCRFVVLAYLRLVTDAVGSPCLLILRRITPESFCGQVEIFRSADWNSIPTEMQEYLSALADDWRRTPVAETEELMLRLEHLSIWPLRVCKTGECNRADLESAVKDCGPAGSWKALE